MKINIDQLFLLYFQLFKHQNLKFLHVLIFIINMIEIHLFSSMFKRHKYQIYL